MRNAMCVLINYNGIRETHHNSQVQIHMLFKRWQ